MSIEDNIRRCFVSIRKPVHSEADPLLLLVRARADTNRATLRSFQGRNTEQGRESPLLQKKLSA